MLLSKCKYDQYIVSQGFIYLFQCFLGIYMKSLPVSGNRMTESITTLQVPRLLATSTDIHNWHGVV